MPLSFLAPFLIWALYVALGGVLIRKYLRTRDAGFIWLGVAAVLWPMASPLLDSVVMGRIISGHSSSQMTMGEIASLAGLVQQTISLGLLLVAVLYLSSTKRGRTSLTAG
jgi:hypothetical protein